MLRSSQATWRGRQTPCNLPRPCPPGTEAVVLVAGNHEHHESGPTIDEGLTAMHRAAEALSSAECRNVIVLENEVQVVRIRGRRARLIGCTLWTDHALFGDPVRDRMSVERALTDYRLIRGHVNRPLRAFLGDFDTLTTSEVL